MISGQKINNVSELKEKILEYINESVGGTFSAACAHVNISRTLGYQWRHADAEFDRAVDQAIKRAHSNAGDFAESKLLSLVSKEEPSAVYFYLKTRHKARGYVEKQEVDQQHSGTIRITWEE